MPTITYSENHGGFTEIDFDVLMFGSFAVTATTSTRIMVQPSFNPATSGPAYPLRIDFTYSGTDRIALDGGFFGGMAGGTLTTISFENTTGVALVYSGLKVDAALADLYLTSGVQMADLIDLVHRGSFKIIGSNDSRPIGNLDPTLSNGDDILTAFGNDTVSARGGDDVIRDSGGQDVYSGGSGFDVLTYELTYTRPELGGSGILVNLGLGTIKGPDGKTDKISTIEGIKGTYLADRFTGNAAANAFEGLAGRDTIDGAGGIDTVRYVDFNGVQPLGVRVVLGNGTGAGIARDGFGGADQLFNVENVISGSTSDQLTGNRSKNLLDAGGGDDTLKGMGGDDVLRGGSGLDRLEGGAGNDTMTGGANEDSFVFLDSSSGQDTIVDFALESDMLVLSGATAQNIASLATATIVGDDTFVQFTGGTGSVLLADVQTANVDLLFGFAIA